MTDKKIFSIRLRVREKNITIPVIQVIFPNGCVLYKIMQKRPVWLVSVNDKWKLAGNHDTDNAIVDSVIALLRAVSANNPFSRVEN